jgi:hypothetical protein
MAEHDKQDRQDGDAPRVTAGEAALLTRKDPDRELTRAEMSTRAVVDDPKTQAAQVSQHESLADATIIGETPVTREQKTGTVEVADSAVIVNLDNMRFDQSHPSGAAAGAEQGVHRDRVSHLCGKKVRRDVRPRHPLAPSLDHVIPLSRGGLHEYTNVRCAHLRCNCGKNNRAMNEQLLLV